jgi:hypothetical protein
MKIDICKYFWECLDKCDFDKYMAKGSSLGGSVNTNVRQQYEKETREFKMFLKKLGVKCNSSLS